MRGIEGNRLIAQATSKLSSAAYKKTRYAGGGALLMLLLALIFSSSKPGKHISQHQGGITNEVPELDDLLIKERLIRSGIGLQYDEEIPQEIQYEFLDLLVNAGEKGVSSLKPGDINQLRDMVTELRSQGRVRKAGATDDILSKILLRDG